MILTFAKSKARSSAKPKRKIGKSPTEQQTNVFRSYFWTSMNRQSIRHIYNDATGDWSAIIWDRECGWLDVSLLPGVHLPESEFDY